MADLTQAQQDVVSVIRAGGTLKHSRDSGYLLVAARGQYTTKVLARTVDALVRLRQVRDTHRLDNAGLRLFELVQGAPPVAAPGPQPANWPFPKTAHDWRHP